MNYNFVKLCTINFLLSLFLLPSYTCNNNGGDNGNLKTLRNMLINRAIFKEL